MILSSSITYFVIERQGLDPGSRGGGELQGEGGDGLLQQVLCVLTIIFPLLRLHFAQFENEMIEFNSIIILKLS